MTAKTLETSQFYDEFHANTKPLKRIPKSSDFSFKYHIAAYGPHLQKNCEVLDIGCGGGAMSLYAASRGCNVTGIDVSDVALNANRIAAKNFHLSNVKFLAQDFMQIDSKKFDTIILTEVLEHIPNDKEALQKINALLSPGGHLLMSVPLDSAPLHRIYLKLSGVDKFDERVGHLRRYSQHSISNLIKEAGFEIISVKENEGLLRNWLFNDKIGQFFMRLNRGPLTRLTSFVDDYIFTPLFGASDVIVVAKKNT